MRIMGIDYGEKRIGVAVSDPMGWTAQGLEVITKVNSREDAVKSVLELAEEYETELIVVGLPINMNGSHGPGAEKARKFASRLAEVSQIPVELWDERLTTMEAEKVLISANMRRSKRRKVIDKVAAVLILQGYLDRRNS
jgi:putative Holliday junction resolvase